MGIFICISYISHPKSLDEWQGQWPLRALVMRCWQRNYFDNSIWLKLSSSAPGPFKLILIMYNCTLGSGELGFIIQRNIFRFAIMNCSKKFEWQSIQFNAVPYIYFFQELDIKVSTNMLLLERQKLRHSQDMKLHIDCNLFKHATIILILYWPHLLFFVMKWSFVHF